MSAWDCLITGRPVNKTAALVINQCGCASELELNRLLDQRAALKSNATALMQKKHRTRQEKALLTQWNKDLAVLSTRLKPYFDFLRSNGSYKPKSYQQAFVAVAKHYLPAETFEFIRNESRRAIAEPDIKLKALEVGGG